MEKKVEQLSKALFFYVKKRVHNQEDAKDLTQKIFCRLANSDSLEMSTTKSWIYTVIKDTISDYKNQKSLEILNKV